MRNVLVSLALLAATGCSLMIDPDGVEPTINKTVQSIAVTGYSTAVPKGATVQLTATATYTDSTTGDVTASATWTSGNTTIATVSSAGGTKGLVKAEAATGSATITATLQGVSGNASVSVAAADVVSIAVTGYATPVPAGATVQLTATATYTDTTTLNVTNLATWTSGSTTVATVNDTTAKGLVTAIAATGTATITAAYGGQTGTVIVGVTAPTVTSVQVTPPTPTVLMGSTQQLTAIAFDDASQMTDVTSNAATTWSSSDPMKATVSATGLVTPVAGGTTTITATFSGKSGTSTVTVLAATVTSITVTPATPTVAKGATAQLTATATFSDTSTADVTAQAAWTSATPTVARVSDFPGSKGLVTGAATSGTAVITAAFGGQSGTATVTAAPAAVVSIAVTGYTTPVPKGATVQLTATATYSDATTGNVTDTATWTSGTPAVATVSDVAGTKGLVTAVAATGTASITATFDTKSGSTTVTAAPKAVSSIAVTPATATVAAGASQQLTATATYTDTTTGDVTSSATWTSSAPAVATVSTGGLVTVPVGVTTGMSTITASLDGKSGTASITAAAKSVASIEVAPATYAASVGEVFNLVATAHYTDSTTANVTIDSTTSWQSTAPGVATVSNTGATKGRVTALSESATAVTITATFGGKSGTATVTVGAASVQSITITPAAPETAVGGKVQLTATATYTDTTTADVTALATWSSGTATVATVDDVGTKGLVTGVSAAGGTATASISASFGGQVGIKVVTVRTVTAVAVTGYTTPVPWGKTVQLTATATLTGGGTQDVTAWAAWASGNTAVATVSNVAGTKGLVTAAAAAGSTGITATLGVPGSQTVTVADAEVVSIAVTGFTTPVPWGKTVQLTATATMTGGPTRDLTADAGMAWSSGTTAAATVDTTTSKGLVTAAAATGSSVITATYTATYGTRAGSQTVTMADAEVVSIAVTGFTTPVPWGKTVQLTATATMTGGPTRDLTADAGMAWSSGTTAAATVDTTTSKGLVTAAAATGSSVITATYTATYGTRVGSQTVTVADAEVVSIAVTGYATPVPWGKTVQLTATATMTAGPTRDVTTDAALTWSTANGAVAAVSNLAGTKGLVTATAATGSTAITATFTAPYGSKAGSQTVTVTDAEVASIAVTGYTTPVPWGRTLQLTATATMTGGPARNVTADAAVTWSTANGAVATVSNAAGTKGVVTASAATGTTTITATYAATYGDKAGSTSVTVKDAELDAIEIAPTTLAIPVGGHQQLTVTGVLSNGLRQDRTSEAVFIVTPTTPTIVTVGSGVADKAMLRAVAEGPATVTATLPGFGYGASCGVTVGPVAVVGLEISLYKDQWNPYQSPSLPYSTNPVMGRATATWSDGRTTDVTSLAAWRSSDPSVSVSTDGATRGQVTTMASPGAAVLSAAYGGVTGTLAVSVHSPVVIWVVPFPSAMAMPTGSTFKLTAIAVFDDWTFQPVTEDVTWTTDAPSVATVSNVAGSRGTVTAGSSVGPALITATHPAGASAEAVVFVKDATSMGTPTFRIVPTPPSVSLVRRSRLQAVMEYPDGSIYDVSDACAWQSSDPTIITVDWEGQALALQPQPVFPDPRIPASITATYPPPPNQTHVATVTPTVGIGDAMIQFSSYPVLTTGQTLQLRAYGTSYDDPSMAPVDVTNLLTWGVMNGPVSFNPTRPGEITAGATAGTFEFYAVEGNRGGNARGEVRAASIQSIKLPEPAIIPYGGTGRILAQATYSDGSTADVTDYVAWSVLDTSIITPVAGMPGTLHGTAVGATTVFASYPGFPVAQAIVRVNGSGVTAITVSPNPARVGAGTPWSGPYALFTASAVYGDNAIGDLTSFAHWSVTDPEIAYVVGSPPNAVRGLQIGSTTVVASYGQAIGTATLEVLTREPDRSTLYGPTQLIPGVEEQLAVVGEFYDQSGTTKRVVTEDLEWSSSDPLAIAVSNFPGSKGRVTAFPIGGFATITGTFPSGNSVAQNISVNVTYGSLLSLGSISPTPISVMSGGQLPVHISGIFSSCATACGDLSGAVTWTMDPLQPVATVGPGTDQYGNYGIYVTGRVPGTTTLCAEYLGLPPRCEPVNVVMPSVSTVTIEYVDPNYSGYVPCGPWGSGAPPDFAASSAFELKACLSASNGLKYDITELALWSSDHPSVTVSDVVGTKGQVFVGNAPGAMATITAWYGPAGIFPISVSTSVALDSIGSENNVMLLRPGSASEGMGGMRLIGRYTDGRTAPITKFANITIGDPTIATLGGYGEWGQLELIGLKPQATWMQAAFGGFNTAQALMTDTRTYVAVQAELDGPSKIPVGVPVQARVVAYDPIGMPWDLTEAGKWAVAPWNMSPTYVPTWASSNPAAAAVSNDAEPRGLVTGVSPGFADIGVTVDGITDTVAVEVTDATLTSLTISPDFQAVPGGGVPLKPFTAIATFSDRTQLDVTKYATWSWDPITLNSVPGKPGEFTSWNVGTGSVVVHFGPGMASATVVVF